VAVFEELSHEQQLECLLEVAQAASGNFDLPPGVSVKMINLSENATYRLEAPDGQRWAVRIHRDGYHSLTAIASELAWLIDLRQTGVIVTPLPVKGKDGEIIQHVSHPSMRRPRHIVLSHWEAGLEPVMSGDLSQPFQVLGEVTARMHLHTRQWNRPAWFERFTWDFETSLGETKPHWGRWRDGVGVDNETALLVGRTVNLIGNRLGAYGKGPERFGLIHCDLRLANLLIDGAVVKVIDFDDCGFGWYMYDAATPFTLYEHEPQVPDLIESWKKGYRKVINLPSADEEEIPTFLMFRRLLVLAWIGSHCETDLAKSLGQAYTDQTVELCESYLSKFA
jgi:Ser/Thr protein kinase RdoA (MazF antagonist)